MVKILFVFRPNSIFVWSKNTVEEIHFHISVAYKKLKDPETKKLTSGNSAMSTKSS